MQFISATTANGVLERDFILDGITGVLWSPLSRTAGSPLLLLGHSGGMHKRAPGLVATALHSVTGHGFTVAAIDAPGHGDRPRNKQDQRWAEAINLARAAGEPIAPIVVDYSRSLAKRSVPEWQTVMDALQTLNIGSDAPIGYGGMTLGVVTGLMLTAIEPRIAAASFGAVFVDETLIQTAARITIPIEYRIPWNDQEFDRATALALFDAFASTEKTLHARNGRLYPAPDYERDSSAQFFARNLLTRHGPEQ